MDTQKRCEIPEIQVHQMKEIEEQYRLLNHERSRIKKELAQKKEDEHQINNKLMWFSHLDERLEWMMREIRNLEKWDPDTLKLNLPVSSESRTTRFYSLKANNALTPVKPDLRRCQKRLVKKGRLDINYLKDVQEEHICSMKTSDTTYSGTQELRDMIESMVQRIQHGNKKRADEMKIYQELSNFMETEKSYIAPEPCPHWYTLQRRSKRATDYERYRWQHKLSIRLDCVEILKREQNERQARVKRLEAELQYVRKKINYINKKLKNVDSKILKAYKRVKELGDQTKMLVL